MAYTSKELQTQAGITGRQMDHWHRRGWLVSFDRLPEDGSGTPKEWPERTLRKAVLMGILIGSGFTPIRAHDLAERYLNRPVQADPFTALAGVGVRVTISLRESFI
jgi:hypothetical protein